MSFWLGLIVGVVIGQCLLCLYGMLMLNGCVVITGEDDNEIH